MRQKKLLRDWDANDTATREDLCQRIIATQRDLDRLMVLAAGLKEDLGIFEEEFKTHNPLLRADILDRMRTAAALEMEQLRPFAVPAPPPAPVHTVRTRPYPPRMWRPSVPAAAPSVPEPLQHTGYPVSMGTVDMYGVISYAPAAAPSSDSD